MTDKLAAGLQDKGYHGSADEQLARLSSELGLDERRKPGEQGLELGTTRRRSRSGWGIVRTTT